MDYSVIYRGAIRLNTRDSGNGTFKKDIHFKLPSVDPTFPTSICMLNIINHTDQTYVSVSINGNQVYQLTNNSTQRYRAQTSVIFDTWILNAGENTMALYCAANTIGTTEVWLENIYILYHTLPND